jgi:uncharacterized protein YjbI with pentapeptide repeats
MRRAAADSDHEPRRFRCLGIALFVLALVGCAPRSTASPGPRHAVSDELRCDESRSSFTVPSSVDARSCVPREEVETLVRRGELQAISIAAPRPAEPNPTALYLRVEIAQGQNGYQTHFDAMRRLGFPSYGSSPTRGYVTVERVYKDETLPAAMMLCEPPDASCGSGDVRTAWCTDMELEQGLRALRIVVPGVPPIELRPPEHPPEIEAYFADSPDGRLLVRVRADAGPFATATLWIDHLQNSSRYRVPIARKDELDCFHDLRGPSHFKQPLSVYVFTPLSWQALGPAEVPLPQTLHDRARFGPVKTIDFDHLLMAHLMWLDTRVRDPVKFKRGDWESMRASRGACPERPTTPARAVLDGVDLAELNLRNRQLKRASLRDAGFADADLDESDLCGADLSDADMRRAHALTITLQDATLDRVDARRSDLWGNMDRSKWRSADLREANLGGLLAGADFASADLRGARVYGDLTGASFQGARLEGVRFAGADLHNAVGLTQPMLEAACAEAGTRLPDGLRLEACD